MLLSQQRAARNITRTSFSRNNLHSWYIVMFLAYITEREPWSLKAMHEISFPIIFFLHNFAHLPFITQFCNTTPVIIEVINIHGTCMHEFEITMILTSYDHDDKK